MTFKVIISEEAMDDIRLASRWYEKQKKGLGKEFLGSIKEYKSILKSNPYFVKRYKQVHTIPIKRFPFMIHYTIDKNAQVVLIVAVLHTSLNPESNWL
jgi:mRNA-degrading endonuclease RelE of RelBE toxin-antitoxin system